MHILEYLCRVSFFTTLDIYKDYFKSRHKECKVLKIEYMHIVTVSRICSSLLFSL